MRRLLRIEYPGVLYHVTSRGNERRQNPFKELFGQVILGREEFIEKTKGLLKRKEMSQEIVERKRLSNHATPEDILFGGCLCL